MIAVRGKLGMTATLFLANYFVQSIYHSILFDI